MPASRSSVSSVDSEPSGFPMSMSKRWTTLETVGRCMFLFSVAFFIIGVLITVFGFSNTGIDPSHQVPLQVLGPSCLTMTAVMWVVGCIFSRLWNLEWKRQQQALELRDRVQLHALAMDILNNPVISPGMLHDPRMRRQLLLKLRAQRAIDLRAQRAYELSLQHSRRTDQELGITTFSFHLKPISDLQSAGCDLLEPLPMEMINIIRTSHGYLAGSNDGTSRRSSRAMSTDSKVPGSAAGRRHSSVQYDRLLQKELDAAAGAARKASSVSACTDTMDGEKHGFDLPGIQISRFETLDLSDGRASICSAGGKGSKRYIIIHSDVASDFSRLSCPSDYSLAGSRSSRSRSSRASSNVSSRLWDFSPRESEWDADVSLGSRESQMSVVKQDWGGGPSDPQDCLLSPNAPRKMSVVTFDIGSPSFRRHSSPAYAMRRKDSGSECTCTGKGSDCGPSVLKNGHRESCQSIRNGNGHDEMRLSSIRKKSADQSIYSLRIDEDDGEEMEETTPLTGNIGQQTSPETAVIIPTQRPPLKRNNTDDSEVERRVARLFREIELSTTESVDESKINSFSSDFDCKKIETKEIQTQTSLEKKSPPALVHTVHTVPNILSAERDRQNSAASAGSCSDNMKESFETTDDNNIDENRVKKCGKEKKSKIAAISSALANLGIHRSHGGAEKKHKNIPKRLLLAGISGSFNEAELEAGICGKSPPPKYEDIMNKNI